MEGAGFGAPTAQDSAETPGAADLAADPNLPNEPERENPAAGGEQAGGTRSTPSTPSEADAVPLPLSDEQSAPAGPGMDPDPVGPVEGNGSGPSGPEDGDPSRPIVAVPGVPCGPNPSLFGLTSTNVSLGGRGVHLAYPCNKHGGAPMVFILNLHGTMPAEELKLYQVAYFSANNLVDSHNFITAAPKSVVAQWGNDDGGLDEPHLMEVIDYVYTTFSDFDIRAMWIAGHSWGAMYSTRFVCNPAIADKVRGGVFQSGIGESPACADRLSIISTAADGERVINQTAVAAIHGCGAEQTGTILDNAETHWPTCTPGFTHANFQMRGKAHADYIDAELVLRIGDLIKSARP